MPENFGNFLRTPFLQNTSGRMPLNIPHYNTQKTPAMSNHQSQHKKWNFPLSISSVNVTKSAGNLIWSHLLKKSLRENFIFCAVSDYWFRWGKLATKKKKTIQNKKDNNKTEVDRNWLNRKKVMMELYYWRKKTNV